MLSRKAYEELIQSHENYSFLPSTLRSKWVSVSKKGENVRSVHWETEKEKQIQLGNLPANATLTNLARIIHPTKTHVCKMCASSCSIYYVYPNKNTIKWLKKQFPEHEYSPTESIFEIYYKITSQNKEELFVKQFGKPISELKTDCFSDQYDGKKLSPGVFGNPPDRLDGFHCYNSICGCRPKEDKGRSDENMKSYSRDRRCYEMYSDGNVLLTNKLMGKLNTIESVCVSCNKKATMTGDHIGPISLGFVHDPINLQALCSPCNSSKNNRFTEADYNRLLTLETSGLQIVSWWAQACWNKCNAENKCKAENDCKADVTVLRRELDRNAKKFMMIIEYIKSNHPVVLQQYIENDYTFDNQTYTIQTVDIREGGAIHITYNSKVSNKKTKASQQARSKEILLEHDKKNRNIKITLTSEEKEILSHITYETFRNTICSVLNKQPI
jgi:Alw26I/Eco31I/Esp3I family type II restriction endonuclease